MKGKLVIPIIGVIILSFFGSSFAEQKVQTKSIQVTAGLLPDLVVDSIWLDNQCNINFKLRNSGKGDIPDREHRESVVRVQFDSEIKDLPLRRVDPTGALKKAGAVGSFNARILLQSIADVKVIVDFNQRIKETETGERNNEKLAKLTPQCPTGIAGEKMEIQKSAVQKIPTPPTGIKADTAPTGITVTSPTATSKSSKAGMGIIVTYPAKAMGGPSDFSSAPNWEPGKNYTIQWKTYGLTNSKFRINLISDPMKAESYEMDVTNPGATSYTWSVPSNFAVGFYYLTVKADPETDVIGVGGGVCIAPSGATCATMLTVKSPATRGKWNVGDTYKIEWTPFGKVGSSVDFILIRPGFSGSNLKIGSENSQVGSWAWKVPSVSDGNYKIRVSDKYGKAFGESGYFEIAHSYTRNTNYINITSPLKDSKWFVGSTNSIKWVTFGQGVLNSPASISLLAPDGIAYPLATASVNLGAKSFDWKITPAYTPVLPGQYRIRVSSGDYDAYSDPFMILP